jgi:dihydrofolate reductase
MGQVHAGMAVSIDGFVEDTRGNAGALSVDSEALFSSAQFAETKARTGAVVMGRRTFDMADDPDAFADIYEFQVPLFVVTHRPPERHPRENDALTFTFVTDGVEAALAQARAAAGEHDVTVVGGPDVIGQLLQSGLVDVLEMDLVPVLLGAGTRFLDSPALAGVRLEREFVHEIGRRTTLGFRVVHGG